jgi:DNA-binding MarR family transcriptional regulator
MWLMETPEQPRWLTEEEQQAWMALAGALIKVPAALDAQLQRDARVSYFEYLVLSWLSMAAERTHRMSELADLVNSSLSRLSHVARRLESHGWLTRRPDPTDGRYTLATLTDEGWDKVVAAAPGHVEAVRHIVFDPLTKVQVKQLREVSTRLKQAAEEQEPQAR